ncbi:RNA polymerase sigma factor [Spirosoma soli]|uniref:RNA polymerase sigma factor n=1 Tax=Spirosoma soli TaxID=1770529 RepID=A0ABW5M8H4_9BACT
MTNAIHSAQATFVKAPKQHPDDSLLWNNLRKGDRDAFSTLYQRYVGVLYNYGYHFVADADIVQDAIQELYIDLWRLRENLSETTSVKFYLFRSLRRRIHLTIDADNDRLSMLDEKSTIASLFVPSGETDYILQEQQEVDLQRLQQLLVQLPPRQYEAIRLRFFDNFSWEEVATIMQMNEQSVRNLIQRAIKKMRESFGLPLLLLLLSQVHCTIR